MTTQTQETPKKKLRAMYVAPKGKTFVACDFSQAESWVVAFMSNEQRMKDSLMFGDIHRDTAANAIFFCDPATVTPDMRYLGKRCNHALAYRMSGTRMAQVINKDSDVPPYVTVTIQEAELYRSRWHSYYNIRAWWGEIEAELNRSRTLFNCYGRKRCFFGTWGDELFKEATAFNPQSTVADHANGMVHPELGIPGGFLEVYRQLVKPYKAHKMVNQAHDSCMLEVPESVGMEMAERTKNLMARPLIINGELVTIPVDAEIGPVWGELTKIKFAA